MISIVISSATFSIATICSTAIDIMKRSALRCAAVAICVSATLAGCETVNTTQPGAIGVDRKQVMSPLVSEQELRQGAVTAGNEGEVLGETVRGGVEVISDGHGSSLRVLADDGLVRQANGGAEIVGGK